MAKGKLVSLKLVHHLDSDTCNIFLGRKRFAYTVTGKGGKYAYLGLHGHFFFGIEAKDAWEAAHIILDQLYPVNK